jgi:hypothetical protein
MGRGRISARACAFITVAGAILAAPVYAGAKEKIAALAGLEPGRWQVRDLDSRQERGALCLGDPVQLVQLEHRGEACPVEVIESADAGATVQYSCSGRGFGHTHVRVETPRLIRVETQGLNNGRPFSRRFEAKRVGNC